MYLLPSLIFPHTAAVVDFQQGGTGQQHGVVVLLVCLVGWAYLTSKRCLQLWKAL